MECWWFARCVRRPRVPLEDYAARFDELFSRLAQRRGLREYLTGLLAPRDRNKTLTGLAGSEPVRGAQHAAVQWLRHFLSQSTWDADEVNRQRLELLVNDPATAPRARGVIAIDDPGLNAVARGHALNL